MNLSYILRTYQYVGAKNQEIISQIQHHTRIYTVQKMQKDEAIQNEMLPKTELINMKTQINTNEVSNYSKRFASMLCNQFYRQNNSISGKQIVELAENKQINFFAVKTIFLKWQDEMANLKSPYFDYTNSEVNKTLTTLTNLLSQNIAIARPTFEPVLQESVADTILVYLAPEYFYAKYLNTFSDAIHVANQIKPLSKYIKVNKTFFDRLLAYLEREANPTISVSRANELLQVVADENIAKEKNDELFSYLSKFIPVTINNFASFDEELLAFDTSTIIPKVNHVNPITTTTQNFVNETKVIESKIENKVENKVENITELEPEKQITTPNTVIETANIIKEKPMEVFTFNEQFATPSTTNTSETVNLVNQQFAQEISKQQESLNETMESGDFKGHTLRSMLPINKKFTFINGLFGGNATEFEQAIDMIDQCNDYHKAIMLIKEKYFRRFGWDLEKDEVKEFYEMVSRKF